MHVLYYFTTQRDKIYAKQSNFRIYGLLFVLLPG